MTQLTNASQSGLDEFNPFSESSQLVRVCLHWVSWPWFQQSKGSLDGCSLNEGGGKKNQEAFTADFPMDVVCVAGCKPESTETPCWSSVFLWNCFSQ